MNILVTGATGFIGSQVISDLMSQDYPVTCCTSNVTFVKNIFPGARVIYCDFTKDVLSETWLDRLEGIDVVVNCVGIFYHTDKNKIWSIHYNAPKALFDACVTKKVKKIIHISALNVDLSNVEYAKSKKAADEYLNTLPIQSYILRPSLVYGRGSKGGDLLLRALSSLPYIIPIPGHGKQQLQPINVEDLSKAIICLINKPLSKSLILHAVGPNPITIKDYMVKTRGRFGFPESKLLYIPLWSIKAVALLGNMISNSIINLTAFSMLNQNNITSNEETKKFINYIGFIPRDYLAQKGEITSTTQDRWYVRLYFLKPILRFSIAYIWIYTAICSLFLYPISASYGLLGQMGISNYWQPFLLYGAGIMDGLLGFATLFRFKIKKIYLLQIIFIVIYSTLITWKLPQFWLDPFAPVAKNIPLLVAIMISLVLESEK